MKKVFVSIVIIILSLFLFSCGNDEPDSNYYVKYEVQAYSTQVISEMEVEITTENGVEVKRVPATWDGTFGPISKSTPIILKVSYPGQYYLMNMRFSGRILISKDNTPFVLKAEQHTTNGEAISLIYNIDY